MVARIDIENDKLVSDNLRQIARDLHGDEMVRAMYQATNIVLRDAKKNAPVDTGRLRNSLASSVNVAGLGGRILQGIVGSNIEYAKFQEEGTGKFAGRGRVKMPPIKALEGWARRHGLNPYLVARAIYKRGGLKPQPFLKPALESNHDRIVEILDNRVKIIIKNRGFG